MASDDQGMTPYQRAALLDVALQVVEPLPFLDALVMTFKTMGRHADSISTAWIGCLYAENEIELLMSLRAAWLRGEDASPRDAARAVARSDRWIGEETAKPPENRD